MTRSESSSSDSGDCSAVRFSGASGYVAACLVALGVLTPFFQSFWISPEERLLRTAAYALADDDHAEAERLAGQVLAKSPRSTQALLIAGRAASRPGRSEDALAYYSKVADDGSPEAAQALLGAAQRYLKEGYAADAERCLRRVLEIDPTSLAARKELVYLLEAEGRTWEATQHLPEMIRAGDFVGEYLLMFGAPESQFLNEPQFVALCRAIAPDDSLPLFVQARVWRSRNQNELARPVLSELYQRRPEQIEVQAQYGLFLLETASDGALADWHRRLPPAAVEHPEIWFVRGSWAKRTGQSKAAARCFWEAVRRQPNHLGANYQLTQLLGALGEKEQAEPFAARSKFLARIQNLLENVRAEQQGIRELVAALQTNGRPWEAAAWAHLVFRNDPQAVWARQALNDVRPTLLKNPPMNLPAANPALQVDLSVWPLPEWESTSPGRTEDKPQLPAFVVSFADEAESAGLNFRFYNGAPANGKRAYMFEFSGGGAAVLDFDGDAWPDLYLTQGCSWPPEAGQTQYLDRLFRNLGDGRFEDVTEQAGLGDERFSQGATIGDFNQDGFPDLYLANIGANRLYRNNGDGTFSDVTEASGLTGEGWTSSCVMADFNGDAWPDLYAATYLAGPEVFEKECRDQDRPVQCGPVLFAAEQDRFYLNLGDGRFRDVSAESGILAPDGKGLGVVAADFDGSHRLSLFVSNDTTANFFFANQTSRPGAKPVFAERGLLSGVALDEAGKAQACMGIAVGDVNADGLLDLFVTNFYREPNTLYLQQPDHSFADATREAKLFDASFPRLGWGVQFVDGELDGKPDLLVLNGHINDFSLGGVAYKMSPQYFRNRGDGRFDEAPAEGLGPYFQDKQLGRALARLDFNRDGLEDFCATHVDAPVALLANRTTRHGHFLTVHLRGVRSERDAIGATVRVKAAGKTYIRQLTAGDGFQASNERQLTFGLGAAERVEELTVAWPSGLEQTFRDLAADHAIVLVEGRQEFFRLPALWSDQTATVPAP